MNKSAPPFWLWKNSPNLRQMAPFAAGGAMLLALTATFVVSQFSGGPQLADQAATDPVPAMAEQTLQLTSGGEAELVSKGEDARQRNGLIPLTSVAIETPRRFVEMAASAHGYGNALQCLTQAIYYEAATEPASGQRAVAQVVLNRLMHPAYPNSVCGVVYQGSNQRVCQFSFTCDGSLNRGPSAALWNNARTVAERALAGGSEPLVGTSTNYHADYVLPRWAFTLPKITQIGTHIFYRLPGRAGGARAMVARWNGQEVIPARTILADGYADGFGAEGYGLDGLHRETGLSVAPDVTDRHAPDDVGGRLDTRTGWRLTISDPVAASEGYRQSIEEQDDALASREVIQ